MEYTTLALFLLGMLGIVIHTLMKIKDINKRNKGNFKFGYFLKLEWPSLAISICLVIVALLVRAEIQQLEQVGGYLGLAFVAIGYMSQSIVYHFGGKAEKIISDGKGN